MTISNFTPLSSALMLASLLLQGAFSWNGHGADPASPKSGASELTLAEREKEIDKQNMRKIFEALQTYRKDHGDLPNWLSDLFPKYLSDPKLLISPVESRTGQSRLFGYADPRMHSSYIYEFCAAPSGQFRALTMKQWKSKQMELFGEATPILRCHLHDPVLSLAYSGDFYETGLFWEQDTNTFALIKRLGPPPIPEGQQGLLVKVTDAQSGGPIAGAELNTSQGSGEFGGHPSFSLTTDEQGQRQIPMGSGQIQSLSLRVAKDRYATEHFNWTSGEVPRELAVKLAPAVSIGGKVQDQSGKPIAGATVVIQGVTRDAVGQVILVELDSVVTEDSGKWRSLRVPRGFSALSFRLVHPEFMPAEYDQDSGEAGAGNVVPQKALLASQAVMILEPGIQVQGRVASEQDQAISGADVLLATGENLEQKKRTVTDSAGSFKFVLMEPGNWQLVIQAKGCATAHQALEVQKGLKPLSFRLAKGKLIQGRVLDQEGQSVPGAGISVRLLNQAPLVLWESSSDAQGRFSWDSAPEAAVQFSVTKEGYLPVHGLPLAEAAEEQKIQLQKAFRLTGTVVDAESGEPVSSFRIARGYLWDSGGEEKENVRWEFHNEQTGAAGRFTATLDEIRGPEKVKFMIRADGYLPVMSASFPASGWHSFNVALKKGSGPKGIVHDQEGNPVSEAEVALLGAGYLSLGKAKFQRVDRPQVARTDAQGRFELPALLASPRLIVVHENGFADVSADSLLTNEVVLLQSWGRIEGIAKAGTKPWPEQEIMVSDGRFSSGLNFDWSAFKTTTDSEGRFSLDKVPPGERQLVRLVKSSERSWAHSHLTPVTVSPGQTLKLIFGGMGRPVVGRVVLSDPKRKADLNIGHRNFGTKQPTPPRTFKSPEEWREWQNSPAVKEARKNYRYYALQLNQDGTFRLENIPPGTYDLRINVHEPGAEEWRYGEQIASLNKEVVIPDVSGGVTDEPFDLGLLTLQVKANLQIGD